MRLQERWLPIHVLFAYNYEHSSEKALAEVNRYSYVNWIVRKEKEMTFVSKKYKFVFMDLQNY